MSSEDAKINHINLRFLYCKEHSWLVLGPVLSTKEKLNNHLLVILSKER
jgi:hypothetical protein